MHCVSRKGNDMTVHYFDSRGRWIAFRTSEDDKNLFDTRSRWIGWLAWDNDDVCGVATKKYLGTLVGDRLLRRTAPPSYYTPYTPYTPYAPYTPYTPYSKYSITMPSGFRDVDFS